ncbi:unnamed protein product (macronuclear) [Paramecium tetraurelia]|uniref:SPX domain-containing protein n=1 Tax=Paramecium tetraurelia TaxID=5888 RepID=A0D6T3_PARTE|nr:uncharacterized protein GSPATT00001791001 [Paramecium tetraurelia]CAK78750.1 unnamed protein product [Paramecium tetraurelia]|eukprot:XP_001446147.1 hypothetical protein (macronuclear) [Paramecium tetraurelia strain d4-2]
MNFFDALPSYLEKIDQEQYRQEMVPEWLRLYLDYETLEHLMIVAGEFRHQKNSLKIVKPMKYYELVQNLEIKDKIDKDKSSLLLVLDQELQKIESFILYKYQDLLCKSQQLQEQIKLMQIQDQYHKRKKECLKQQFYELYMQQLQFQSFIQLHTRIMQQLQYEVQYCFKIDILVKDRAILDQLNLKLDDDKSKTHQLLSFNFYPYDPDTCRKNLEKYSAKKKAGSTNIYLFGLFFGVSVVVITILLLMRLEGMLDPENEELFSPIFPSIRGGGLLLIYYWLLTLDQYIWIKYQINYKLYLGFNHHFSTLTEVIKRVSFLSTIYLLLFLITCIQVEEIAFKDYKQIVKILPLLYWVIFFGYLLIPTIKKFNGQGRRWMYRMLKGALFTHFLSYDARYTFVLDQFVSLFSPIRDLEYTICYYSNDLFNDNEEIIHYKECESGQRIVGDICLVVVFSLKCLHCLTLAKKNGKFYNTLEMWNFLKNLLAVSVGIVGCLNKFDKTDAILWIILAGTFTILQQYWEIKNDWLFLQPDSKFKFLRSDLAFINPHFYYFLIILNMFVISAWTFTISPQMYLYLKIPNQQLFIMIVGIMELTRRFIHNLIKVEKEHILNLRRFRSSKDLVYPFEQKGEILAKVRQSNAYNISVLEFQRLSQEFTRNTQLNFNKQAIEILLQQPYDQQIMKMNSSIDRKKIRQQLQTEYYIKLINQYS